MKQICYVSRATAVQPQLLGDLRAILSEARDFNHQHQLTGVLYFADGQFFQCLEGEPEILDLLIEKLKKDPRHQGHQFFETREIQHASFAAWSMKYVGRNSQIQHYFTALGFGCFDPQQLDQKQMDDFLQLLKNAQSHDILKTEKSPN